MRLAVLGILLSAVAMAGLLRSAEAYETSVTGVKVWDIPGADLIRYFGPTYSEKGPDASMVWQPRGEKHRGHPSWVFYVHLKLTYPVANREAEPWRIRGVDTHPDSPASHTATKPKVTCNPGCVYVEESNLSILPYFLMESAGKPLKLTIHTLAGRDMDLEVPAAMVDEFIATMGSPTEGMPTFDPNAKPPI
jgi:hypothetical protein